MLETGQKLDQVSKQLHDTDGKNPFFGRLAKSEVAQIMRNK